MTDAANRDRASKEIWRVRRGWLELEDVRQNKVKRKLCASLKQIIVPKRDGDKKTCMCESGEECSLKQMGDLSRRGKGEEDERTKELGYLEVR